MVVNFFRNLQKNIRLDMSLVCFILVILAAIPVTTLRSKTYSVGYDLGKIKQQEKILRQKNVELQSNFASVQRTVRDKNLQVDGKLALPGADEVLHVQQKAEHGTRDNF